MPLQLTTASPSKSSPSTEEPKSEQKEQTEVVSALTKLEPMADDIKADFEKQNQETEDFMTTSDKIACKTPEEYYNLEELEDMGAETINQKIGRIEDI